MKNSNNEETVAHGGAKWKGGKKKNGKSLHLGLSAWVIFRHNDLNLWHSTIIRMNNEFKSFFCHSGLQFNSVQFTRAELIENGENSQE